MVLAVVAVSFFKPLAFSRYFVVLLPALIPWLALRAERAAHRVGQWLGGSALALLLFSWWWHSFMDLDPALSGPSGPISSSCSAAVCRRSPTDTREGPVGSSSVIRWRLQLGGWSNPPFPGAMRMPCRLPSVAQTVGLSGWRIAAVLPLRCRD